MNIFKFQTKQKNKCIIPEFGQSYSFVFIIIIIIIYIVINMSIPDALNHFCSFFFLLYTVVAA